MVRFEKGWDPCSLTTKACAAWAESHIWPPDRMSVFELGNVCCRPQFAEWRLCLRRMLSLRIFPSDVVPGLSEGAPRLPAKAIPWCLVLVEPAMGNGTTLRERWLARRRAAPASQAMVAPAVDGADSFTSAHGLAFGGASEASRVPTIDRRSDWRRRLKVRLCASDLIKLICVVGGAQAMDLWRAAGWDYRGMGRP